MCKPSCLYQSTVTTVPVLLPETLFTMLFSSFSENTSVGIRFSMHMTVAVRSSTFSFLSRSSWYVTVVYFFASLLHRLNRLVLGEQFADRPAGKRCEDLGRHTAAAADLRHVNAVHDRRQHADGVGLRAIDRLAASPSPEIASADDDRHLRSFRDKLCDLLRNLHAGRFVKSGLLITGQSLAAQFQKYSSVCTHVCSPSGIMSPG